MVMQAPTGPVGPKWEPKTSDQIVRQPPLPRPPTSSLDKAKAEAPANSEAPAAGPAPESEVPPPPKKKRWWWPWGAAK